MKIWKLFGALCIATMAIAPLPAVANISDMLDMSEKLDQIEKQDFQAAIDKANNCTQARDFACTNAQIGKAAKSASDSRDQQALVTARQNLSNEKLRIAEEVRLSAEEARRLAVAEERLRVAQAEQQQQAEQSQSGGFQWSKAIVMLGTGVVAGGHLSSAAQGKYIEGVLKDSMPGQDGISNTTANANAYAAEQKARQNLAAQQARVQQANALAAEAANNERLLKAARESRQTNGEQQRLSEQKTQILSSQQAGTRANAVQLATTAPVARQVREQPAASVAQGADFDALGSQLPKTERYMYGCGRFSGEEMMARESSDNCIAEVKQYMAIQCFPGGAMHETNITRLKCAAAKSRGAPQSAYRDQLNLAQGLIRRYSPECNPDSGCRGKDNLGNN